MAGTPFIGRERELQALLCELARARPLIKLPYTALDDGGCGHTIK